MLLIEFISLYHTCISEDNEILSFMIPTLKDCSLACPIPGEKLDWADFESKLFFLQIFSSQYEKLTLL